MIEIKKSSSGGILTKTGVINGLADITFMKSVGIELIPATPTFDRIMVLSWIFYFPTGLSVIDDTFYLYGFPFTMLTHDNALGSFTLNTTPSFITGGVFTGMKGASTINHTTNINAGYSINLQQDTDSQSLFDGLIHYKILYSLFPNY